MNFNDLTQEENKVDQFIENKEIKSNLELLEENTKKTVELLNKFTEQIPTMIDRIERVGKYVEIESVSKVFSSIQENTEKVVKNQENIERSLSEFQRSGTHLLRESKELLEDKSSIFKYVNWILVGLAIVLCLYSFILFRKFDYYMEKVNGDIQGIHKIMKEDIKSRDIDKSGQIQLKSNKKGK